MGDPTDIRVMRLGKKVSAGADFIQTQGVYDVEAFAGQVAKARERGITERTAILAGIIVPKSAGMLEYMNSSVAGVRVPQSLIDRMRAAKNPREEGIRVTVELIKQVREIPGVRGVHLQAIEWEEAIPTIVREAGLFPRPTVPPAVE